VVSKPLSFHQKLIEIGGPYDKRSFWGKNGWFELKATQFFIMKKTAQ